MLHFNFPYWTTAQHYVGYTTVGLEKRMSVHRKGRGSKLVKYALKNGNDFEVTHIEEFETAFEARQRERELKKGKRLKSWCSVCKKNKENFETNKT